MTNKIKNSQKVNNNKTGYHWALCGLFAAVTLALSHHPAAAKSQSKGADRASLGSVLQQRKKRFLPCYRVALKQTPALTGRMVLQFSITPAGKVKDAKILRSQRKHPTLHRCLLRELSGWRFPARGKSLTVSYPLHLTPGPLPSKGQKPRLGRLKKHEIQRVVRTGIKHLKRCYEAALKQKPALRGKVVMGFVISTKGDVVQPTIQRSQLQHKQVEACLLAQARQWKFPTPRGNGIVRVTYPFTFRP